MNNKFGLNTIYFELRDTAAGISLTLLFTEQVSNMLIVKTCFSAALIGYQPHTMQENFVTNYSTSPFLLPIHIMIPYIFLRVFARFRCQRYCCTSTNGLTRLLQTSHNMVLPVAE